MSYLHSLNPPLLHRDLKTPNIFLRKPLLGGIPDDVAASEHMAKIGDFGLSSHFFQDYQSSLTKAGNIRESNKNPTMDLNPRWAAPEILMGSPYSTKCDVYAMRRGGFSECKYDIPHATCLGKANQNSIGSDFVCS